MALLSTKNEQAFGDDKMNILFGSKTRVRLLKLFLENPQESFYVREMTRMVALQINSIRRELANLLELGIIEINENKNLEKELEDLKSGKVIHHGIKGIDRKYYQLNKNFLLYTELRNLFSRMNGLSRDAFIERLSSLGNITLLLLSGFFVHDDTANIDLLLVGDVDKNAVKAVVKEFSDSASREINYTLLSDDEFRYRQEVVDRFLYVILQNQKNMIIIDKRNNW